MAQLHGFPQPAAEDAPRSVCLLGATGSIGSSTLSILEQHPSRFQLATITAQERVEELIAIAERFRPRRVVIGNAAHYVALKAALGGRDMELAAGEDAIAEAACQPVDMVVAGIVGAAALVPVYRAIEAGRTIALANKECLVCAGSLMMDAAKKYGATLLPVDSEHNALFQVWQKDARDQLAHVTLTASGGPFRTRPLDTFDTITPEEAVAHPNWSMGAKISVDSATMMNKGLEMIEAMHLFALQPKQVEVVIHPQSVVHGLVHYHDGSVLAQLGMPDMRIPLAHTLAWPQRIETSAKALSLSALGSLTFEPVDMARYPSLSLVREVMDASAGAAIALNAANEVAVSEFLSKRLGFNAMLPLVREVVETLAAHTPAGLGEILQIDREARRLAQRAAKEEAN